MASDSAIHDLRAKIESLTRYWSTICYDSAVMEPDPWGEWISREAVLALFPPEPQPGAEDWIKVADQEPPAGEGVLIRAGDAITTAMFYKGSDGYTCWLGCCMSGADWEFEFAESEITHWKRLPAPPSD